MRQPARLLARLFITYCSVLLIGTVCIIVNNIVFHQATLYSMLRFQLPFLLLSDLVFALILLLTSWWRLKPVLQGRDEDRDEDNVRAFKRLLQFPYELLGGIILLALMFILLFHSIEIVYFQVPYLDTRAGLGSLLINISTELSITFVIALLLLVLCKSNLRPYLLHLSVTSMALFKRNSILRQIHLSVVFGFIILLMVTARICALMLKEGASHPSRYFLLLILYLLFVISMVLLSIRSWRRDLAVVHERLRLLSEQEMIIPMGGIPIFSYDETASLALSFNKLQSQLASMHKELAGQLSLARQIQQRLMPATLPQNEQLELAAYCQPCYEVGGDFYDVIVLNDRQLLMAIGDVSGKGMSAAMLMSAVLAALRIEAAKGGSPGEILTRLNEQMFSITQGKSFVTVGLAIIDVGGDGALVQYSSAGHMSPYLITENGLHELERAAVPLGMFVEQNYREVEISFKLAPDQLFIMYTDGIIEALDTAGQMFGFESWEQELLRIDRGRSVSQQLQQLLMRLPRASMDSRADDRTILLMRYNPTNLRT